MLTMLVVVMAAFGLIFAGMYGHRVREGIIPNPDLYVLHHQMGVLGSTIALLCWGLVWWWTGNPSTIIYPYWWVGVIPFTLIYGFEWATEKEGTLSGIVENWFVGSFILCIPLAGPVCTLGAFGIFLSSVIEGTRVRTTAKASVSQ